MTVFLEHKNSEPAMKIFMRNIGMTLHVIHTLRVQGITNLSVNMDWQHLIMNGESLGEYAALLAANGLLGHQPEHNYQDEPTAEKVARAVGGLGDLIDGYEFHYPQELSDENLEEVRQALGDHDIYCMATGLHLVPHYGKGALSSPDPASARRRSRSRSRRSTSRPRWALV